MEELNKIHMAEKCRMATLLRTPELAKQVLPTLREDTWMLEGNKWLASKMREHLEVFHTVPTCNILYDYLGRNTGSSQEDLSKLSAGNLLDEYQKLPDADIQHYSARMLKDAADTKIRTTILERSKSADWDAIKDAIDEAQSIQQPLPKLQKLDSFKRKPKTDKACLLNDWAFERQGTLAIVAPTGVGKSVLTMQLGAYFACGKPILGFEPNGILRVLTVQSEDSDNDIATMRDGAFHNLTDEEIDQVNRNVAIVRLRGLTGNAFFAALDRYCSEFKPDVIFVNPVMKYFDGDAISNEAVTKFFNRLEPLLERHNCGAILVHHTTKQKENNINPTLASYAGFGSSIWGNSVRDTMSIRRAKTEGYYIIESSKRQSQFGWTQKYMRRYHLPMFPHWVEVSPEEVDGLKEREKENTQVVETRSKILRHIPASPESIGRKALEEFSCVCSDTLKRHIDILIKDGTIREFAFSDGKKGRQEKRYSRAMEVKADE